MNQKKAPWFLEQYGFGIWQQESLIGLDLKKNMHWQTDQKSQLVKKDKDQIREQRETRIKKIE